MKEFGFVADPSLSTRHNAINRLGSLPIVDYWCRPTKLAFHDLTSKIPAPRNLRTLLGQGMKFIPTPFRTTSFLDLQTDQIGLHHLERAMRLACFFLARPPPEGDYNPRMTIPSEWQPHDKFFPKILKNRLHQFAIKLYQLFKPAKPLANLSLPHRHALTYLRSQHELLVVNCDKNLGPALIERDEYIKMAIRDHLHDTSTYSRLSSEEADAFHLQNMATFALWLIRYRELILPDEHKYLHHSISGVSDPFPYFYLLMKVHKKPLKTRPIVSYSGSYFYGLGVWVDHHLKQVAITLRSYLKSSFELRAQLHNLTLPPGRYRLFTADATSMYTNIDTTAAVNAIRTYIESHPLQFHSIPLEALIEAIKIIMTKNIFQFGNTTWRQLSGTAMGAPPAPSYATLSFGTHEETLLDEFPTSLAFYRRYIDDVFGIWKCDNDPDLDNNLWATFSTRLNAWHGLEWIVSDRTNTVDFLDITLTLRPDNTLHCTLFEKEQQLHLYLPPRSAHPPGMLYGLIAGNLYRIKSLCSDPQDATTKIMAFWHQLLARGYTSATLKPLFAKAFKTVIPFLDRPPRTPTDPALERMWLFKLIYHPQDPPSDAIRHAWEKTVACPPLGKPLERIDVSYQPLGHRRFLICYKRPPNLGNLLSYRKLKPNTGPPVSSFL